MKKIILSIVLFLMVFSIQAINEKPQIDSTITTELTIYNYQANYMNICFYNIKTNSVYDCEMTYNKVYMTLDDNTNIFTISCPSNSKFNAVYTLQFYEITEEGIYYTVTGLKTGYYGSFLFGVEGITFLLVTPDESFLVLYGI